MRKKIIMAISALGLMAFASSSLGVNATKLGPLKHDNTEYYVENIDISGNEKMLDIIEFQHKAHSSYGRIKLEGEENKYKECLVKDVAFSDKKDVYEDIPEYRYITYSFKKLVDIPVKSIYSFKSEAGMSKSVKTNEVIASNEDTRSVADRANLYFSQRASNDKFAMGMLMSINSVRNDNKQPIRLSSEVATLAFNANKTEINYPRVEEQELLIDNSQSDKDIYFDLSYRQQFRAYFITEYMYNYKINTFKSGFLNLNKNYEYLQGYYNALNTYLFLLPVGNPYVMMSKYYDNSAGNKVPIIENENKNTIFI